MDSMVDYKKGLILFLPVPIPDKEKKVKLNFYFHTSLLPQRSVKTKIQPNSYFNTTFRNASDGKG